MASVAKRTWTHNGDSKTAWVVRYTDQSGKRRLKTFDKKKDADSHRNKVETELSKGTHTAASSSITVQQAAADWQAELDQRLAAGALRKGTVVMRGVYVRHHILPFLGTKKLADLDVRILQQWANDLLYHKEKPRARESVIHAIGCLRFILDTAHLHGKVGRNVLREIKIRVPHEFKDETTIPTKDEIRVLLTKSEGMLRVLLYLAVFTGMRAGEIRGLDWSRVNFDERVIEVRQAADSWGWIGKPKSSAGIRDIPIGPTLLQELRIWRVQSPPNAKGLLFATRDGNVISHTKLHSSHWRPFLAKVGLANDRGRPAFKFHALRHAAASLFIESGLPPKRIQQVMGHASIQMTFDRYGHLFDDPDLVHDAARRIDKILLG